MIGNDIIDLVQTRAESNWKRRGFLEKIFTEDERQLIFSADDQEVMIWILWSRKEAAYKIYNRQTKERLFMPRRISCSSTFTDKEEFFGQVKIDRFTYFSKTNVQKSKIYTEAVTNLNDFQRIKIIDITDVSKNSDGIPNATVTNNPVSITHHGRFERCIQLDINSQSRL
jgi:phosphopantetheinyl transferase (holo-ACP synthase)